MSINGIGSGGTPAPDSIRKVAGKAGVPSGAARPADNDGDDSVSISDASRTVSSGATPAGTLDPAKLQLVTSRIESGYYDRADVRDAVARKVAKDL